MFKIFNNIKQTYTFHLKPFLTQGFSLSKSVMTFFFKITFQFDIIVIYFFTNTLIGYCIYLFCLFYGFFGCFGDNCDMSNFYAAMLVISVFSITLQTFILLKIPLSRKYIEIVVGKNFIESYLGVYSGTVAASMAKVATPIVGATIAEISTSWYNETARNRTAAELRNTFYEDLDKAGKKVDMQSKEFKQMRKDTVEILKKHPQGIITQGMNNDAFKHAVTKTTSTIGSIFGRKSNDD